MSRRPRNALALGICACVATAPAFAQDAATSGTTPGATGAGAATQATAAGATETPAPATAEGRDLAPTLSGYYQALLARRLVAPESGTDQRLRALVQRAEAAYLRESYDETTLLLFEVVESPRFADFSDLDDFRGAEFMLAGALSRLGAARTAARYLDRILARGPSDAYFAPAVRRYVDLALETGDFAGVERSLSAAIGSRTASLSADSQNELRYLRARLLEANGDAAGAERAYAGITRRSRFYAGAQYLRGVIAANQRRWRDAERLFCSIVETPDESTFTFYVDDRYFEVKDQAWLALGRVAHERVRGRRADDAFYYFFQVPQDSPRLAEAFFGAAYAMYEREQHDAAIDVLDQLDALFPDTAFADEGAVLRGYIHLGRCEFDPADRLFRRFIARYDPVLREIQNVLRDPARQAGLYASLLDEERAERDRESRRSAADRRVADVETRPRGPRTVRGRLLEMLVVDDEFYRLHADVRILDAESGRAGRLYADWRALRDRVRGGATVRAAVGAEPDLDEVAELRAGITEARDALVALRRQVDAMRERGARPERLRDPAERATTIGRRIEALERRLAQTVASQPDSAESAEGTGDLDALLRRDVAAARRLPRRVEAIRERMIAAANDAALRSLRRLHTRLGGLLRRARIGRIDAVMGSQRRIERQIESLAAGRFPAEWADELRARQGLIRDDEEYWPYDGEYWDDEYVEDEEDEEDD